MMLWGLMEKIKRLASSSASLVLSMEGERDLQWYGWSIGYAVAVATNPSNVADRGFSTPPWRERKSFQTGGPPFSRRSGPAGFYVLYLIELQGVARIDHEASMTRVPPPRT